MELYEEFHIIEDDSKDCKPLFFEEPVPPDNLEALAAVRDKSPVANAATLQLAACCPNFEILEIMLTDVEWRKEITNENLVFEDGCIRIPDLPGLGLELNEECAAQHPYIPHDLRHYTGAIFLPAPFTALKRISPSWQIF